ncbi:MAG: deoxyguanosinetriphosphate triphosphohydrolase [Acidimicrobiia bacterium]|nr:deoxyguanosinetriphosphate triphosphohydrolase [Acidimicrobiia bacterium]
MSEFILRDRAAQEAFEEQYLAPGATHASQSKGRAKPEPEDDLRTAFERDRDRILHSKSFRRLKHKTQVFMNPEGDHFVTRLTHTLKVTQIGRAIAEYLSLNVALAEAVCIGHDVGHSPFGHTGEDALSEFVEGEWLHSAQSVRIFEVLEPLNLTWEVIDGIRAHSWRVEEGPATPEGAIVRYADRIAYLSHDAEDAIRAGVLRVEEFPEEAIGVFGDPGRQWIDSMIRSVVDQSLASGTIEMEPDKLEVMHDLRAFMFERVYLHPAMEPHRRRAKEIVRDLVGYFKQHPDKIPESYRHDDADLATQVIDYVAGMTDRFAIKMHDELFRPRLFD